ncbi:MAG: hydrolase [Treponema sp.]|nr:MAG: hydrolase [Treponema sp.]
MVNKTLILKLFEAFSIQRWTDMVRPVDLIEMDKAAEKVFLAFIIGKYEEKQGNKINWNKIIDSAVFELFRKIVLSDIKSPVQRMISEKFPAEYKKLNSWVFDQYKSVISDELLLNDFNRYLFEEPDINDLTWRVLRAAHKYSTIREFEILKVVNEPARLGAIQKGLQDDIKHFMDLKGIQLLFTEQEPYTFILEIEKLKFQARWNQTPRIPATSVLGHSLFVAVVTHLISRRLGFSEHRQYNNFFAGLFHDLPEAVTRDIISPVKRATEGLPDIVKEIEDIVVREELLPLIDPFYRAEVEYFVQDEFENRCEIDGKTQIVEFNDLENKYTAKAFKPTDGKLVRLSDHIAAFVEADRSIAHGITSKHLQEGRENILSLYKKGTKINGFNTDEFFDSFRN